MCLALDPAPLFPPETSEWILTGSLKQVGDLPTDTQTLCHLTSPEGGDGTGAHGDPCNSPSFGQFSLTLGMCFILCLI